MKLSPGNIWSGDPIRAVFTNPTELAFRKGNLRQHYPITFNEITYVDAEAAYQAQKELAGRELSFEELRDVMVQVLVAKLDQYPVLIETIDDSGGVDWILSCSHITYARTEKFRYWEGWYDGSAFIQCLARAYLIVKEESGG